MRNFFKRQQIPNELIQEAIHATCVANSFLHPEWNEQEVMFNSIHAVRTLLTKRNPQKKMFEYAVQLRHNALQKMNEIVELEQQLQLHTDNNN